MRLVFPIAVVALAAHISPLAAVTIGLSQPHRYADLLVSAHPTIAAFGGIFLLMIFLDWLFEDREIRWLTWLEAPLARVGRLQGLSVITGLLVLASAAATFASTHAFSVLMAGIFGLAAYLAVSALSSLFEDGDTVKTVATGGLFSFLYLELLDASFSFDSVTGALAVSDQIFVIALGLGIGALFIRSLTVYLVRKGTLKDYIYLEHGAPWAIGALAVLLLASIGTEIPELVTGLTGVGLIIGAFVSSLRARTHA